MTTNDDHFRCSSRITGYQDRLRGRRMVAATAWYGGIALAALCLLSALSLLLDAPEDDPRAPVVLATLAVAALVVATVGGREWRDVRLLDRLQLTVTSGGIVWGGSSNSTLTWPEIRHITLTGGRPGRRRLQVDATHRRVPRRWLSRRRRQHDLDLPVDWLSQEALDVVQLLRRGSGGRFPDRYPRGRFDQPALPKPEARRSTAADNVMIVGDEPRPRWWLPVSLAAMYVGGAVATLSTAACALLVVVWAVAMFVDRELHSTVGSYLGYAATALGASVVPYALGRREATDTRQLRQFRLEIHPHGITWSGTTSGNLTWQQIRHVVFTNDPPGRRRLQVDAGRGPEPDHRYARSRNPDLVEFWSTLRRGQPGYEFALDLPVDRLSREALEVFRLLRRASADRFPDRYPPGRFTPPQVH